MHTSAVPNTQESFGRAVCLILRLHFCLFYFPLPYIFFSLCIFVTPPPIPLSEAHTYAHRKGAQAALACQTDSTLFQQFIRHSNEAPMDLARPSSISSYKWSCTSEEITLKFLLFSELCLNFFGHVYLCNVIFVPETAFMDSKMLMASTQPDRGGCRAQK